MKWSTHREHNYRKTKRIVGLKSTLAAALFQVKLLANKILRSVGLLLVEYYS